MRALGRPSRLMLTSGVQRPGCGSGKDWITLAGCGFLPFTCSERAWFQWLVMSATGRFATKVSDPQADIQAWRPSVPKADSRIGRDESFCDIEADRSSAVRLKRPNGNVL